MMPYKLQLVQHLKDTDKPVRRDFCIAMQQKMENDGFDDRLVFSDEATFHINGLVYVPPIPRDVDELKARITEAVSTIDNAMLGRVWQELDYRLDVCRVTNGAHIEHL